MPIVLVRLGGGRAPRPGNRSVKGVVLIDGTVKGIWHSEPDQILVEHLTLSAEAAAEVEAEAERVAALWHPHGANRGVRMVELT